MLSIMQETKLFTNIINIPCTYNTSFFFIIKVKQKSSQGRSYPVIISITSQILRLARHIGIVLLLNYAFGIVNILKYEA